MNQSDVVPTIEIALPSPPEPTKFERERSAFYRLLPDLLSTYRGQFVAVHGEQVVDSGPVRSDVAARVLDRIGSTDIFVGLVSVEPERAYRSGVARDLGRFRGSE